MGSEKYVYFASPDQSGRSTSSSSEGSSEEGNSGESDDLDFGELMVARISASSRVARGQESRLVIDTSKVRLFDAESEQAIL